MSVPPDARRRIHGCRNGQTNATRGRVIHGERCKCIVQSGTQPREGGLDVVRGSDIVLTGCQEFTRHVHGTHPRLTRNDERRNDHAPLRVDSQRPGFLSRARRAGLGQIPPTQKAFDA